MIEDKILWLDVETTGADTKTDRICELSMHVSNLECDNITDKHHWYINPTVKSVPAAYEKHKLTFEFLSEYPLFSKVAEEILSILGKYKYIGGYNIIGFDIPILIEEFSRCNLLFIFSNHIYIDSYKILIKHESRKLENVYKRFTGKTLDGGHSAANDVDATIELFPKIISKFDINDLSSELITFENALDFDNHLLLNEQKEIVLNFGKYRGRLLNEILESDSDYIFWVLKKADQISNVVKQIITNYLNELIKNETN